MELLKISDEALIEELHRRIRCSQSTDNKQLILIGAPGSGKGTNAQKLQKAFCLCQISAGDILRNEVRNETKLGKQVQQVMEKGDLVSDDIILNIIMSNLKKPECSRGAILDGFPLTLNQAKKFDSLLKQQGLNIWKALHFNIENEALIQERLKGRLVHLESGRSYHQRFNPPQMQGIDDVTGEKLVKREDDNHDESIKQRLNTYKTQTSQVIDYYSKQGLLVTINAEKSILGVWRQIKDMFQN